MDRRAPRNLSPPRRLSGNPARNSTGLLDTTSSGYDAYYNYPRSSREVVSGPRSSGERLDDGHRRYAYPVRDPPPVRRSPDYDVPPRRVEQRGPPKVVSPVHTSRPIVRSTGPSKADEGYYLTPGTSRGHHRAASTSGRTSERSQYSRQPPPRERHESIYDRDGRSYHNTPAIRQPRDQHDRDYGYEYTDFKEQARRDLLPVPRQRSRRESDAGPRERPSSMVGLDDGKRSSRADGPPVTTRGFAKMPRNGEREYRGSSGRAPESDFEPISRRRSTRDSDRGSISVHQERDAYSSAAEDGRRKHRRRHGEDDENDKSPRYDERSLKPEKRHHERRASVGGDETRRHRHRHHRSDSRDIRDTGRDGTEHEYVRRRPDDSERSQRYNREEEHEPRRHHKRNDSGEPERHKHRYFGEGAAALGAAATAAGFYAKSRYAHDKEAEAKSRSSKDDNRHRGKSSQEELDDRESDEDSEVRNEQRHHRRREHEERDHYDNTRSRGAESEYNLDSTRGNGVVVPTIRTDDGREHHRQYGSSESSETETSSAANRQIMLVNPEKEEVKKPKGILKSPKVRFPEDPAPVREGVAPLKEAGKKGIPPNARWTKIDRRLVNPAALEVGNERFEERDDYVIVLRVLSKDEIKAYAAKTAELRDERRYEDEQRERMLAIEARQTQMDPDEGPQLQLDNHPYNQEPSIPGITTTAPPAPALASAPSAAAPSSLFDPNTNRPEAHASPESQPHRPEAHSSHSYVRMPPGGSNSSVSSSISNLTYPAPPPLQSSPQPAQQPLGPPPPGAASYPPPQPPPTTVYPPPNSTGPTVPIYYPPPQGPTGGQQSFPPPPSGSSEPYSQNFHATEANPPIHKVPGETESSRGTRSPQESDGPERQA